MKLIPSATLYKRGLLSELVLVTATAVPIYFPDLVLGDKLLTQ